MKTCLYSALYLDGVDASGTPRLERNLRYLEYYSKLREELGFRDFQFCDNGSSKEALETFSKELHAKKITDVEVFHFQDHLKHGPEKYDYPYCWRSLHHIRRLIDVGYRKIIAIDSDGFIVSKKLAEYVRVCSSGWEAFWDVTHSFPTSEFYILNADKFEFFLGYTAVPWERMVGLGQEDSLPFSRLNGGFLVGRFGEKRYPQTPDMDFYGQAPGDIELEFDKK